MKTYCLVCKKYTNNSRSRVLRDKKRLMLKSNCSAWGNRKNMCTSKGIGLLDSLMLKTPQNRMKNALWSAFR